MPIENEHQLATLVEDEVRRGAPKITLLVREYEAFYNDKPIFRLLQQFNQLAAIYKNILEDIKRYKAVRPYGYWQTDR